MSNLKYRPLLESLAKRSFPQLLIGYVIVAWSALEILEFLFKTYGGDPLIIKVITTIVLASFPSFVILAWFHGGKGAQGFTKLEILLLSVSMVFVVGATWTSWKSEGPLTEDQSPAFDNIKNSIAILPFETIGDSIESYYSEGIVAEILGQLSSLPDISVISRDFSSSLGNNTSREPREIGRLLGVTHYLSGSIQKSGSVIRVRASLIDTRAGTQEWSNRYESNDPDIFDLQDRVAEDVARSLAVNFSNANPNFFSQQRDSRAFELFSEAKSLFNTSREAELVKSIELFEEALEIEPDYSLAYAGLIESYVILGFNYVNPATILEAALKVADRAEQLLSPNESVYRAIGFLKMVTGDFLSAEKNFKEAIEKDPENAATYTLYATLATYMGRFEEARNYMDQARQLDPLSVESLSWLALHHYYWREFESSIATADRVIQFDPSFPRIHLWRGSSYEFLGNYQQALEDYRREISVSTGAQALSVRALQALGDTDEAIKQLDFLVSFSGSEFIEPFRLAQAYMALGDTDKVFDYLNMAQEDQSFHLITLNVEPMFDPVRNDPRFKELLEKTGINN